MTQIETFVPTDTNLATLAKAGIIPDNTPREILQVFAWTCNEHGLSPAKKEIYLVRYGQKYNTIVGIDGLRTKASRTGQFAGRDDAKFNMQPDGTFQTASQLAGVKQKPLSVTVTVYRVIGGMRCPFTKTILFSEYCPAQGGGKWETMPFNMIEKCCEAAVLRMAFAEETAGLTIEEEGAAIRDVTISAMEISGKKTQEIPEEDQQIMTYLSSMASTDDLRKYWQQLTKEKLVYHADGTAKQYLEDEKNRVKKLLSEQGK